MESEYSTLASDQYKACVHHWLIDAENLGVCKKCGVTKQFCGWWDAALIRKAWSRNPNYTENVATEPEK